MSCTGKVHLKVMFEIKDVVTRFPLHARIVVPAAEPQTRTTFSIHGVRRKSLTIPTGFEHPLRVSAGAGKKCKQAAKKKETVGAVVSHRQQLAAQSSRTKVEEGRKVSLCS